ncbi:hypothetical protein [Vibrio penaeicida]|uniref:DUF559 domain-containing protein n=2 Tax=Vibrio penaeicida TaxID=104609 RepID=A0AAV5NQH1_9VIBR|nr:hypothetical protein [Vibrio penaeicida]GLQ72892.1 hypothetical protein GCM10007932_22520 [Vibrio penaeicida]
MIMSRLEAEFALQIRALKLPVPETEFRFHPVRQWRFDFAWSLQKFAVEIEGGGWNHGRHTRGKGFSDDLKKYSEAMRLGWQVYRCDAALIKSGEAIQVVRAMLEQCEM